MTTAYSLTDTLPKDLGGAKFQGLVNAHSTTLDFALHKGIGASTIGGKILAHTAIGTHTQASAIEALHPFAAVGGVYLETTGTSPVLSGQGQIAGISQYNELYTVGAPKLSFLEIGSTATVKSTSGLLYTFNVAWSDENVGDMVHAKDNGTNVVTIVFDATSGYKSFNLPDGGIKFATNIQIVNNATGVAGATSVMGSYF